MNANDKIKSQDFGSDFEKIYYAFAMEPLSNAIDYEIHSLTLGNEITEAKLQEMDNETIINLIKANVYKQIKDLFGSVEQFKEERKL